MKRLLPLFLLLVLLQSAPAEHLSPLAHPPNWKRLDTFQRTITRDDFVTLLNTVYAPHGAWEPFITVTDDAAQITTSAGAPPYILHFADAPADELAAQVYWRPKSMLPQGTLTAPLTGLRIALDPGHLGGDWAHMEERWFQIGQSKPVAEGDMTLYVAKLLAPRLQALGATVYLTRTKAGPTTTLRPEQLQNAAKTSLEEKKDAITPTSLTKESDRLFYRVGEIRRRAALINTVIKPDIVICLHFNAEAWGDLAHPTLVDKDHLHFLVTGAFQKEELAYDDQRYDMLLKLLNRVYPEEVAVTRAIAKSMVAATGLPPFQYFGPNAVNVGASPYIWARNLLANRLFDCPVVYVESYVMNSREVFAREQAGDYPGRKNFGGVMRKSIYREYADGIVDGLVKYYSAR